MKRLSEGIERIFSAVAFAESGEFETARMIMSDCRPDDEPCSRLQIEKACLPEV
jgi:hypothetical protein